ncbi:BsuPI-related putative proteinase inhibitor [Bacillus sp. MRMR6]|uniref:BsuPI-related putative proteinase inhibitor n=1 Tax=Bacillus sp. MRMR6 TaxID=1928617 RepID=UPI00095148F6|nr:BsuPI-related putative proteinase inhibitor [Bacillus sp. MRMR6]OLS36509.1 hypothetical protein BTR25_18000 [Bacillus sp. MRMR6]
MRIVMFILVLLYPLLLGLHGIEEKNDGVPTFQMTVIPRVGPESAEFEITIENKVDFPMRFEFQSSQLIEISVVDVTGKEVYLYSKDRYFLQALQQVTIEPGGAFTIVDQWDYFDDGKRVPEGEYTVNVRLIPNKLNGEKILQKESLSHSQNIYIPAENPVFRMVKASGNNGKYVITGKTMTKDGLVLYSVEDGHEELLKEQQLQVAGSEDEWRKLKLEINIPKDKLPKNGTLILKLYERNDKGQEQNVYPLVLEMFKQ